MNKTFSSPTYSLLIVALIFIFNGFFAMLQILASLLTEQEFPLDWRFINVLIGLGLLARKRFWYVVAFISLAVSAFSHIYWLSALEGSPTSVTGYLAAGLALDVFQFVVLVRANIRALYFPPSQKR
jgi:hypothetical protein